MKTSKTSRKVSKIKLRLEDFNLDEIENLTSINGGQKEPCSYTTSDCTSGDSGCCDDNHVDDMTSGCSGLC